MSRGKYAARAANRRAEAEVAAELTTYQKRVAALTAEVKQLKQGAVKASADHAAAVRRLVAERDEGVSPMLTALETENKRLRQEVDQAHREVKKIRRTWTVALDRLVDFVQGKEGLTRLEAIEKMAWFCEPDQGAEITLLDNHELRHVKGAALHEGKHAARNGPSLSGDVPQREIDRVRAIQRARGERK